MIVFSVCKYFFIKDISQNTYSLKNLIYRSGIIIIFVISNLIEGTTHLLSYKI